MQTMNNNHPFGSLTESFVYAFLLLIGMWLVFWAQQLFEFPFHEYGVLPKTVEGLKGILFMPMIHAPRDVNHILNNSFPTFVLLATIIYFYRDIALKVIVILWLGTGLLLWAYATNNGAYHIGMSGVIYAMVGFVFTSGVVRKYLPLQAISLFVVFAYGNLIWGIFPIKASISWEGHFMGLVIGFIVALIYRKESVQRPKFQFEIEKEMGIEPPDLEGMYYESLRLEQMRMEEEQRSREEQLLMQQNVIYHYLPKQEDPNEPKDETPQ